MKSVNLSHSEEFVSYDIESLFTSIPVDETIEYICDRIYVHNKFAPFCKKRLTFKRLLQRLTKECVFSFNNELFKQIDGCPMGGSLSVDFAGIFMAKMEEEIVKPYNPLFYKRYVDDIITKRSVGKVDCLYSKLNDYHPNVKLTAVANPKEFLDTS